MTRPDRDPRLRDGQPALGREGARARRRRRRRSPPTPSEVRAADGLILPGVGAFPRAMERVRELGLDELIAERRAAGVPILGICLGLQLLFDSTDRARRRRAGSACSPGAVAELDADGLKVPHIGWSPVRWERESRLAEGIESETPFYFVHSFAPRPAAEDLLGTAAYGARFACAARARQRLRRPVPPREVERRRPAPALQLRRDLRGRPPRVILYPAIDIRGGQAVRLLQGDYERETAYDADPVDAARRWADDGAALPPRRRPRRRQGRARRRTSRPCGGSPPRSSARSRSAAACATPTSVDAVLDAGAERVVIGTAALRDPELPRRGARRRTASGSSSRSTPATARSRWRAGPRPATATPPRPSPSSASAACSASSSPRSTSTARWRGPAIDELNAHRRGDRRPR